MRDRRRKWRRIADGIYDDGRRLRAIVDRGRTGRREKRFPRTTDLAAIKRWRAETAIRLETRARHRRPDQASAGTVAARLEAYLARPAVQRLPSSASRASDVRAWIAPIGPVRADRLTADQIASVIETWQHAGVAGWTLRHRLTALRQVFADDPDNPARLVPLPRKPRTIPRAIDYTTIRTTLNQIEPCATKGVLLIMAFCGFRPVEIRRTEPWMLRLDGPAPHVIRPTAKGGDPVVVPLSREGVLGWQMYAAHGGFATQKNGTPRTFCNANRDWRAAMARAGFEPTRCYDLVHSYCTQLLQVGGADLSLVQKARGHRDIRTTQVYTQVLIDPRLAVAVTRAFEY